MGGPPGERPRRQSSRLEEMMNSGPRILERSEAEVVLQQLDRRMHNADRELRGLRELIRRREMEIEVQMREHEQFRERAEQRLYARTNERNQRTFLAAYVCIYACILYLQLLGGTGRINLSTRSTNNVAKSSFDEMWLD
ncbi:unnamed protein product [Orchesella dallaii]|uniref:Uncharacterized protein n=1 Tax=Orchesella dallaii TaxID=48710 RepID=A0ABP1R8J0_9HEXA